MKENRLAIAYSLLSIIILSFYGIAVCPYIDSLPSIIVVTVFMVAFVLHGVVVSFVNVQVVARFPPETRALKQFIIELSIYIFTGIVLSLFNLLVFDFPLESGLKVVVGTISIGLFASIDNALLRERKDFDERKARPGDERHASKLFPVTRKLAVLFSLVMLITAIVLILVLSKDSEYLVREYMSSEERVLRAFFIDVFFVMAAIMIFSLRVLYSYSKNLRQLFDIQVETMTRVGLGDLATQVPVMTRDEFRLIAQETNRMIEGLREKERIRSIFGKVVSRTAADHLLSGELEKLRDGLNLQVAVLFCDIRSFTALSESIEPGEVVQILNGYFSKMVEIVEQHHGVVDKYIGDAILAVFGLEMLSEKEFGKNIEHAVRAAIAMNEEAVKIRLPDGKALRNGIGLHAGQVIAGTIGSPDRFEFTVIGDTVNTASRLEGLCKQLGQPVVLSGSVYKALPEELKTRFSDLDKMAIRGREGQIHVFAGPTAAGQG